MSWDIFAVRLPEGLNDVADIPDDFSAPVFASQAEVISAVLDVAPDADFTDPTWGEVNGPGFSVEVNVSKDPCDSFAFHVRGSDSAIGFVAAVLERLGIQAFDPQSDTGIFDASSATTSMAEWREFRDRSIGQS